LVDRAVFVGVEIVEQLLFRGGSVRRFVVRRLVRRLCQGRRGQQARAQQRQKIQPNSHGYSPAEIAAAICRLAAIPVADFIQNNVGPRRPIAPEPNLFPRPARALGRGRGHVAPEYETRLLGGGVGQNVR
jgi:hypothetical protein